MEQEKLKTKILFTGGHLTPALAVVDFLKDKGLYNIYWAGVKYSQTFSSVKSAEFVEVKKRDIKFYSIWAGKLWRKWTRPTFFKALFNFFLIPFGFIQAFFLLIWLRPALIISFGGYVALPIVFSGWILGIKSISHEQTIVAGSSNKIIAKLSKKIMLSWKSGLKYYPAEKAVLTGNPIRNDVLKVTTNKFLLDKNLPTIYFTGGNQGSNTINWRLFEFLPELLKKANVIHQTGHSTITNDYEKAKELYLSLPEDLRKRYVFFDNLFGPEIGEVYDEADLIVTRAGANTVSEILALNKYALFIPIPWSSHNEQQLNAEYAVKAGCGEILKQRDDMKPEELFKVILHALKRAEKREIDGIMSTESLDTSAVEKIYAVIEQEI